MPEFIPRPRESRLAEIIARFGLQNPIADGIASAGGNIGLGIGGMIAGLAKAKSTREGNITDLLKSGQLEGHTGTVINGQKVWDKPSPGSIPLREAYGDKNYPEGMSYKPSVKKQDEDKTKILVTPEIAKEHKGLVVGSMISSTFLAEMEGKKRDVGAGGMKASEKAQIEGQIMDDYLKSPTFANLAAAKNSLRDLSSIQSNKSGAGDIAAIYSFIKTMDPNAVKEGEVSMTQSTLPGLDRIKIIYDNMKSGNKITPAMKKDLLSVAHGMYSQKLKSADEFRAPFVGRSKQYGINPDIAVPNMAIPQEELDQMLSDTITVVNSKGKEFKILRDNLDAAKKRDPKLKIKGA